MFNKLSLATIAAIGLVSASPTFAAGKKDDSSAAPKEQSQANGKTKYCAQMDVVTGSIRQGRICKTANQWRADGIDVTKLQPQD